MMPGTIVLPSNVVFVMKSFSNFSPLTLTAECSVTMVVFVKCNVGKASEAVMTYLQDSLRFRINDVESGAVADHGATSGRFESVTAPKGEPDIVKFTIRTTLPLVLDGKGFAQFPFEDMACTFKLELSHFTLDNVLYRFDIYRQDGDFTFKDANDLNPEWKIRYSLTRNKNEPERKTHPDGGDAFYFPHQHCTMRVARDATASAIKIFIPSLILSCYFLATYAIPEVPDLLANLSVCLLAFFALLTSVRAEIPNIPFLCVADKYMYTLVVFSLLPIARIAFPSDDVTSRPNLLMLGFNALVYFVANGAFAFLWCASRARLAE